MSESVDSDAHKPTPCPHKKIVSLYNEICVPAGMPFIEEWDQTSAKNLQARWRSRKERQDLDFWRRFFVWISGQDYLCGRVNSWRADLHWIVKPSNFAKTINGKYLNSGKKKTSPYSVKGQRDGSDYYNGSGTESVSWAD